MEFEVLKLEAAERRRYGLLPVWLQVGAAEILETDDGFAFWIDPTCHITRHLEEFIAMESRTCPFLRFVVREDPARVDPVLDVSGAEGAKQFLASRHGIRGQA